jgi:hypothetical protein
MLTLFAAAALASTTTARPTDTLRYEIAFVTLDSTRRAVDIRLQFRLPASGRTVFGLPHMWAGHSDLESQISNLRVTAGKSGLVSDSDSSFAKIVTGRPGALVDVRYRLRQDWTGPVRRPEYFAPSSEIRMCCSSAKTRLQSRDSTTATA